MNTKYIRDEHIDFYKALAFINMFLYHFVFNLQNFKLIDYNIFTDSFGILWRVFIIGTFLITMGASMVISSKTVKKPKIYYKNSTFQLFIASIFVSIFSYIVFPNDWIYFGILHFILFCKIFLKYFVNKTYLSLFLGCFILIAFFIFGSWNPFMQVYGLGFIPSRTQDIVNFLPWLAFVFFGFFLGNKPLYRLLPYKNTKYFSWISNKSLILYILHQAILFPLVYIFSLIL